MSTLQHFASDNLAHFESTDALADLRSQVVGAVLTADDAGYEAACAGFNLLVRHRPAVVVVAQVTQDVAAAVRFAASAGLRVAIQATGHGAARPADGALLIVTSELTDVTIDPEAATADVSAGAKWERVLAAAQQHGLAPLLGSTTDVGAIGYTLGGGMGWLGRRFGLCSDSVIHFDLVTADGATLRASNDENPEVFWALKGGGGGSLGVVTGMRIRLFPVTTVYAGNLLYPAELAGDVIRRFRDWAPSTSRELTSSVVLMNFPPVEDVPEPLRGKSFVMVRGCWSGDLQDGERLMRHWRDWRAPIMDMFAPMPFAMADLISQDPTQPMPVMVSTEWFDTLPGDAIDILIAATFPKPGQAPTLLMTELRNAGGAVRDGAAGAVNDRGRSGEFLLEMVGVTPFPEAGLWLEAHLRFTREKLRPYVTGAAYLNFTEGVEKQDRTLTAFSTASQARIAAVKAQLDPANRFSHGFALPIAA